MFKLVLDEWLQEAGVQLLLHTVTSEVLIRDRVIGGVVVEHKGGREVTLARRVIGASGDGDLRGELLPNGALI